MENSTIPLKPLHLAESLGELKEKAIFKNSEIIKNVTAELLLNSSRKIFEAAEQHISQGDEELSYIYYCRFVEAVLTAQGTTEYQQNLTNFEQIISPETLQNAFKILSKLSKSLQKRYSEAESNTVSSSVNGNQTKKKTMENFLKETIVGQRGAVTAVTRTIRRKEQGWSDANHPIVFLFLGPSGTGKTELAKQMAKFLFSKVVNSEKGLIRIDMSEYYYQHTVARFIGSPPGYKGFEEGGQLTEALRKCPNAVVLFDEVEKAHADVLNVLLQLFDEGRLTDGQGRTVECKGAIFVMTSNLGSEAISRHAAGLRENQNGNVSNGDEDEGTMEISEKFKNTVIRPILKANFQRDEFLGRINETVFFLPFSKLELNQLITNQLKDWAQKAKSKHHFNLKWDGKVIEILSKFYNSQYGAGSVKHEVERRIVNEIASAQEKGLIVANMTVYFTIENLSSSSNENQSEANTVTEREEETDKIVMKQQFKGIVLDLY